MHKSPTPEKYDDAQIQEWIGRCVAMYGKFRPRTRDEKVLIEVSFMMALLHFAQSLSGSERQADAKDSASDKWLKDDFPLLVAEAVKELDWKSPAFTDKIHEAALSELWKRANGNDGNSIAAIMQESASELHDNRH
jgi:hypothetical protein